MALIKLGLESLESLIVSEYENDGYHPVTDEQLQEHELYSELVKILKAVKPDYNKENVFTLAVENGYPTAVYGFSLINVDGKAVLQFGAGNDRNEVILSGITEQNEAEEDITVFKAGNARLEFLQGSQGGTLTNIVFGKNKINIYAKWKADVSFDEIENAESVQDLALLLDSLGVAGFKLTDLVRPYVRKGLTSLPKAIKAEVLSWTIGDPHPEYGVSVLFNIKGVDEALTKDGKTFKNPGAVYVNSNQMSAMIIQDPKFAQKVIEARQNGGKLLLVIPAMSKKDPEKYMPSNLLEIVPGNVQTQATLPASKTAKMPVKSEQLNEKELELLEKF